MDWPKALGAAPEKISIQAYHQDQVERAPQGSVVIASSAFCAIAGLYYPGFAISFQGHPEFAPAYTEALLESRRGTVLKNDEVDAALASQSKTDNRHALAGLIAEHLQDL